MVFYRRDRFSNPQCTENSFLMDKLSNDLASKLSPAAYAALMSHLSAKERQNMTGGISFEDTLKDRVDPSVGVVNASANDTLTMKLKATEGLNVEAFAHVDNMNAGVDEDFGQSQCK